MPPNAEYPAHRSPAFFVSVASFIAVCLGLSGAAILYSWYAGIRLFMSMFPGLASLNANTGAGFLLAGLALWLQRESIRQVTVGRHVRRAVAHLSALSIMALGALTLAQNFFNVDLKIDQFLYAAQPEGTAP